MQLLLVAVVCLISCVSLISEYFFLFFSHIIYTSFKLLEHECNVGLRFGWQCLLVLYRLRVQVEHDNILIHAIPLAGVDLSPKPL